MKPFTDILPMFFDDHDAGSHRRDNSGNNARHKSRSTKNNRANGGQPGANHHKDLFRPAKAILQHGYEIRYCDCDAADYRPDTR